MNKRFVSIWFPHLLTDYYSNRSPSLKQKAFVITRLSHGKMFIVAANLLAEKKGVYNGMVLADARALIQDLHHIEEEQALSEKLLNRIAQWCIRFSPVSSIDHSNGIILNATGCAHLWGGEANYLNIIKERFAAKGYIITMGIASTIGSAWAIARYRSTSPIAKTGNEFASLAVLPPSCLRLEEQTIDVLSKLGLHAISQLIHLPRESMRRRFGVHFLLRLDQALGNVEELITAVEEPAPYSERLPCIEPIITATCIEIALEQLINNLCERLQKDSKGVRAAVFKGYRVDNRIEKVEVNTSRPTHNEKHLFKLFEIKIDTIEPALGIELFTLDALVVEEHEAPQSGLWNNAGDIKDPRVAELIDQLAVRLGNNAIQRFLPAAHHWPERSVTRAASLEDQPAMNWNNNKLRPIWIVKPELIQVTAPVPDYPPMNFRHKGKLHLVKKADGPERIEPEWWLHNGEHRDYYLVEDELAGRYWIFRSGHYDATKKAEWFLHGYFG